MRLHYLYITIALVTSLFIYVFFRTNNTVINEILIELFTPQRFLPLKRCIQSNLSLSKSFIYSLPEGLWAFCATLTSKDFFIEIKRKRINLVYLPLLFTLSLEGLQYFHVTNGVFDFLDIGFSLVFWVIGYSFFNINEVKKNLFKEIRFKGYFCIFCYVIIYLSHVHI